MFFLKATNSFLATGENIRRPATCDGKLDYEGEFGIVIGKTYANVSEVDVAAKFSAVLASYSCINDVTAVELLQAEATFDQWTRGQSFDTLGVFGPVMANGWRLTVWLSGPCSMATSGRIIQSARLSFGRTGSPAYCPEIRP